MSDTDDVELMIRFQRERDYAAFEELFRRHKDSLLRFLLRLTKRQSIAEDISQQTWLKVIDVARQGTYNGASNAAFRSWLYTLARNHFIDEHQRKFAATRSVPLPRDLDELNHTHAETTGLDEHIERLQIAQHLNRALQLLPYEQREVVALWAAGVPLSSMIAIIGAPRETILSRKKYAISKLRAFFARSTEVSS